MIGTVRFGLSTARACPGRQVC